MEPSSSDLVSASVPESHPVIYMPRRNSLSTVFSLLPFLCGAVWIPASAPRAFASEAVPIRTVLKLDPKTHTPEHLGQEVSLGGISISEFRADGLGDWQAFMQDASGGILLSTRRPEAFAKDTFRVGALLEVR